MVLQAKRRYRLEPKITEWFLLHVGGVGAGRQRADVEGRLVVESAWKPSDPLITNIRQGFIDKKLQGDHWDANAGQLQGP